MILQRNDFETQKFPIFVMLKAIQINFKVHLFWEGHNILWNLHLTFVLCSTSQK